ncbi:hypothetical protein [Methanosalsum zhilinae]|uniref:hypothetical protein n=1 Tax=Methanosalsum zhilinae TaxID=39669 RepID=UPI0006620030|nr:hypothetical protein [Methanosalsum zhilinae]
MGTFLEEIKNPLIELIEAEPVVEELGPETNSPLKRKMVEQENLVNMYTKQGHFRHTLESLVLLAQLKELENGGNPNCLFCDYKEICELV